ncbi:hypothetical protein ANCCEY_09201 [Ancylostoma ceylanicum]|uniref:Protein kinase domain-containing protein n=1 Tax=Ancylostoma ceylanicum TaxID=53326 RepID=A0A0D6LNT6_9BILA|nr:hypothetical protein ANCCEY_09201 [Ancylostoma ceylanicum]
MKWRTTTGTLCDKKMPIRLKYKVYRTVVRPVVLHGTECWAATKVTKQVLHTMEMRMLRWSMGVTLKDKVSNEMVRSTFGVAPIIDKMREARLRWFGHVCRTEEESVAETALNLNVKGTRVRDQKDLAKEYAMKVEKKLQSRRHSKLKMEIAILKLVSAERTQSHFTTIIDRGKKETFFFLVMQLVGRSLANLKMTRPLRVFSMSTGLGVGIQCLEACEDLHKYGFIHRDLKPANYACGLGEKKRVVYILDFGIARKILNSKGELKAPRQTVRFKVSDIMFTDQ